MFEVNLAKALETATKAEQEEANTRGEVLKGTVLCLSKKLTSYSEGGEEGDRREGGREGEKGECLRGGQRL